MYEDNIDTYINPSNELGDSYEFTLRNDSCYVKDSNLSNVKFHVCENKLEVYYTNTDDQNIYTDLFDKNHALKSTIEFNDKITNMSGSLTRSNDMWKIKYEFQFTANFKSEMRQGLGNLDLESKIDSFKEDLTAIVELIGENEQDCFNNMGLLKRKLEYLKDLNDIEKPKNIDCIKSMDQFKKINFEIKEIKD